MGRAGQWSVRLPCAAHGRHASWGRLSSEGLGGTLTPAGNCHWPTRCHGPAVVASVSRDSGRVATDRLFGRAAHCSHGYAGVSARPLVQLTNVHSLRCLRAGTQSHRPCQARLRRGPAYKLPVHCVLGQGLAGMPRAMRMPCQRAARHRSGLRVRRRLSDATCDWLFHRAPELPPRRLRAA